MDVAPASEARPGQRHLGCLGLYLEAIPHGREHLEQVLVPLPVELDVVEHKQVRMRAPGEVEASPQPARLDAAVVPARFAQ